MCGIPAEAATELNLSLRERLRWSRGGREGGGRRVTQNNTYLRSASEREHTSTYSSVCEQGLYRLQGRCSTARGVERHKSPVCCCMCSCVLHTLLYIHCRGWHEEAVSHSVSAGLRDEIIYSYHVCHFDPAAVFLSHWVSHRFSAGILSPSLCLTPSLPPSTVVCLSLSRWCNRESS